jgi:ferrous iron transport protein B
MIAEQTKKTHSGVYNVAIAGNPNCGKTTLFNGLTGSNQRIGNWPGVTVEKKEGSFRHRHTAMHVIDLPGIYSLSAYSEDEQVARGFLLSGKVDMVINILDATNLERNLYLTTQLLEMKIPIIIVLNMMDLAQRRNLDIDVPHMEAHLGCPVIPISAVKREDIENLKDRLVESVLSQNVSNTRVSYSNEIEDAIEKLKPSLGEISQMLGIDRRWTAVKIIENDRWVIGKALDRKALTAETIQGIQQNLQRLLGKPSDTLVADYRYGFTHGIVRDVVRRGKEKRSLTERIDKVVLNRALGVPIFLVTMYIMFFITMNVGGAFIDFFDGFFSTIFVEGFGVVLTRINAPAWLVTVLAGGVGGGIRTMGAFIPIIFTMFFMLSILEDSGYMARAAFVMDRFMRWIGLPGKAFVPLLVGFGCTVPAIMATRTLENRRDRILTVFISPFMSCGARFPVYALFAAAFFARRANVVVFSLYVVGIVLAILTGLLLKGTLFRGEPTPFVMELPPYHSPRFRHIMYHSWNRLKLFMLRARVLIPMIMFLSLLNSAGVDGSFGNENSEKSILSKIGKAITPVFSPIGIERDNWPASVALFTGLFAKEAVVGTLNALYNQMDMAHVEAVDDEGAFNALHGIGDALRSIPENLSTLGPALVDPLGVGVGSDIGDEYAAAQTLEVEKGVFYSMRMRFTGGAAQAYAYMLFVLIYAPCIVAVAAMAREIGYGLTMFSVLYLTGLGWIVSTLFYQITVGHSPVWIVIPLVLVSLIYGFLFVLGRRSTHDAAPSAADLHH